jgi:hypothetical protein
MTRIFSEAAIRNQGPFLFGNNAVTISLPQSREFLGSGGTLIVTETIPGGM